MRTIFLYGALADEFAPSINLEVETVAEAIRAITMNYPAFTDAIKDGEFEVIRGDLEDGLRLGEEDLIPFKLGKADLHIVPVIGGSKRGPGGLIKTVLGIALIGAVVTFGGGFGALIGGGIAGQLGMVGLALTVTGVAMMLAPANKPNDGKQDNSFTSSGPGNTYTQGGPLPLIYGKVLVGSVLISGGMTVEPIPVGWNPSKGDYFLS